MDPNSFILGLNAKNVFKDLQNLNNLFDLSNLKKNHELFSINNEKNVGRFIGETRKNVFVDEYVCLRSKAYSFKHDSIIKTKWKIFLNLNQKTLNLKNTTIVNLEENIQKNVIFIIENLIIMKCVFKGYVKFPFHLLMRYVNR